MADELESANMIAATLTLEQAVSRQWDAVIVGAGPAGALAAGLLARQRASVLLVDRAAFPRTKVCGCCINPRALSALATAGLEGLTERAGARQLDSLCLAAGRRTAWVQLKGGVALSRSAFDAALVRSAIGWGAAFLPETTAKLGPVREGVRVVTLRQRSSPPGREKGDADLFSVHKPDGQARERVAIHPPGSLPDVETGRPVEAPQSLACTSGSLSSLSVCCRLVLAADGLGSLLLSRGGVGEAPARADSRIGAGVVIDNDDRSYAPGIVYMTCGKAGYAGLVRLEDGRLDVACALDAAAVRAARGPGSVVQRLIAEAGWPVPAALDEQPWRGTIPLTRRAERVADHRLFALGDATGYVEPFTGEGIAWALASAVAVTPLAIRAVSAWQPELASGWRRLHQTVVTRRQLACRLMAGILRRPWLTKTVVSVLSRLPSLAVPVLHYLNDSNGVGRHPRAGRTMTLRDLP
jgi:flavin-dependent dehydrogenase